MSSVLIINQVVKSLGHFLTRCLAALEKNASFWIKKLEPQPFSGVADFAVLAQFKVYARFVLATATAGAADHFAAFNPITCLFAQGVAKAIHGHITLAMVNNSD